MKAQITILITVLIVISGLTFLLVRNATPTYTKEERVVFTKLCNEQLTGYGSQDFCDCLLTRIEENHPYSEWLKMEKAYNETGRLDERILTYGRYCQQ